LGCRLTIPEGSMATLVRSFLFTTLIVSILGCSDSHAQVLVGPVIGGQLGWVTFKEKENRNLYSSKPGFTFNAGASVSFRMSKTVFLHTTLLYSQKNKNLSGNLDPKFSNKAKLNFIDMPISFTKEVKMRFGKGKYYNLYFGAGPTVSYWLGGKGTLKNSELNENTINPPNYDLPYTITFENNPEEIPLGKLNVTDANRIQLGLNFTAGVVFEPMRAQRFMFTLRYELGHSYFSQNTDGDYGLAGVLFYEDDMQSRPQSAGASLFYFIDLKTEDRKKGKSTSKIKTKRRR
jgi:hypothetical protein